MRIDDEASRKWRHDDVAKNRTEIFFYFITTMYICIVYIFMYIQICILSAARRRAFGFHSAETRRGFLIDNPRKATEINGRRPRQVGGFR